MIISTMNNKDVALYVADMLRDFEIGLQSITITKPLKSEDSSALTVIGMSSDDIDEDEDMTLFSYRLANILQNNTSVG